MSANGHISVINCYPVKSLGGSTLASTQLGPLGIEQDRRWALRDLDSGKVLSAKLPSLGRKLLMWSARFDEVGLPIVTIDGTEYAAAQREETNAALSNLLGRRVALESAAGGNDVYESYWPEMEGLAMSDIEVDLPIAMSTNKGTYVDLAALHIITTSSLNRLAELAPQSTIDLLRFRPSLVIDTGATSAFVENDWVDQRAQIGSAKIQFGTVSPRCVMTSLAQHGLAEDRAILQTLSTHNRHDFGGFGNFACLGIYAEVIESGSIAVGDPLDLITSGSL